MRFGIMGTAAIARNRVMPAIRSSEHEILAVASRDADRAAAMADEFDAPRSYGSYGALLEDDALDAVYIPLPNALHEEWTIRAADAGLPVLCEKPLADGAAAARRMRAHCADRGVTLMEAYMHRYHPRTRRVAEIAREELDRVLAVSGSFQAPRAGGAEDLVSLNPDLAGGSLMHTGCYPVTIARLVCGEPSRAFGIATDTRDCGVDTMFAGVLEYADGATARVASGYDTGRRLQRYRIEATNGWIEVHDAFVPPDDDPARLEWGVDGRHVVETFDPVDQYRLEVDHFADCVRTGEEPVTNATEGVRNMAVLDALYGSADAGDPVEVEPE